MRYIFQNKTLNIPDEEIENNMKHLDLTKEQAIELWLEDNEYIINEEQEQLTKKAKDNKITATIHKAKAEQIREKQPRERKENPTKEKIIKSMAEFLQSLGVTNLQVVNISKLITFDLDGNNYKLDLIQTRNKKRVGLAPPAQNRGEKRQ